MNALVPVGIVVAGFVGTLIRVTVAGLGTDFHRQIYGTLAVNIAGSFLLARMANSTGDSSLILGIGAIGALTTFSTFISQVERLGRETTWEKAAAYVLASVILGVTAALIGLAVA